VSEAVAGVEPFGRLGRRVLEGDSMTDNLEIVRRAYAAFGGGDMPALLALFDPEIVWVNPGPESLSYFGTHRGPAAIAKNVFGFLAENLQFEVFEPREFFANETKVVVLLHMEAVVRRTGQRVVQEVAHVFSIRGGRVVAFHDFQDSWALARALTG
jgi:uncharacterized protein